MQTCGRGRTFVAGRRSVDVARLPAEVVGQELDQHNGLGMSVTRSFFFWPVFMPTPDALDQVLVDSYADFSTSMRPVACAPFRPSSSVTCRGRTGTRSGGACATSSPMCGWLHGRPLARARIDSAICEAQGGRCRLLSNEIPIYGTWRGAGSARSIRTG
jgi:hypothetical protein